MDTSILSVIIVLVLLTIIGVIILSCKCRLSSKNMSSSFENAGYHSIDQMDHNVKAHVRKGKPKAMKKKAFIPSNTYASGTGPSGLKNTQQTFYINAMVQAMAASNILIMKYNDLLDKCCNIRDSPKLRMFINLLNSINNPTNRKKCVQENTNVLKEIMKYSESKSDPQQDALRVFSTVINTIQNNVLDILQNENMPMPPKIRMLHTYTKSGVPNEVHDHLAVVLSLFGEYGQKSGVRMKVLLDAFFGSSRIENNSYETTIYFFEKVPEVLTIHILATELDPTQGTLIKSKYHLRYKETISYKFNIQIKLDGSELKRIGAEYQLVAIVHQMNQISVGHYVTYRLYNGNWYLTSDEQIVRMSFSNDIVPYVMIYEKTKEEELKDDCVTK